MIMNGRINFMVMGCLSAKVTKIDLRIAVNLTKMWRCFKLKRK